MANHQKIDPIRDVYFSPLQGAERVQGWLFFISALLSIAVIFIDRIETPRFYQTIQIGFLILVLIYFGIGLAIRFYLFPRAEGSRSTDLLANAFSVTTVQAQTIGYYNNSQKDPYRRLAANLLESSFFSKNTAAKMANRQLLFTAIYGVIWIVTAVYHEWDIALTVVVAQVVFSEQIFSQWVRLQWLRNRFETAFKQLSDVFESPPADQAGFQRRVWEQFWYYETSKANAGVLLSFKIFLKWRDQLNKEWDDICKRLGL